MQMYLESALLLLYLAPEIRVTRETSQMQISC